MQDVKTKILYYIICFVDSGIVNYVNSFPKKWGGKIPLTTSKPEQAKRYSSEPEMEIRLTRDLNKAKLYIGENSATKLTVYCIGPIGSFNI